MPARDATSPVIGHAWDDNTAAELFCLISSASVQPLPKGNRGRKKENTCEYVNMLSAFDIETTTLKSIKQAFMYVWQWYFLDLETERSYLVYGRTWDEWLNCCAICGAALPGGCRLVVLDHNLSFEHQFISEYIDFAPDDIFATDVREIVKETVYGCLEFRCTLRHSNASLSTYTKQWHVEHQKLSGDEFDYNKIRYPWTPLTENEMLYAFHDVIGLVEAYLTEMEYWHDTLYTVPMTSTGYVRRICKKEWSRINYYDRMDWIPSLDMLERLHLAFRGGDTHASRFHATPPDADSAIIVEDVQSWDRASSYPDVLVNCRYPMGEWYSFTKGKEWIEADQIDYLIGLDKAVLMEAHFKGLELRAKNWEMPYIPKDKLLYFDNIVNDNGRILKADHASIMITDVDWEIIRKEYTWKKVYFSEVKYCRYRLLPDYFRDVVKSFFADKTRLKGSPEGSFDEIEYNLKKQLLNALYGMAAQWPIKSSVYYDNGEWLTELEYRSKEKAQELGRAELTADEEAILDRELKTEKWDHYHKRAFVPYQVGVWTTAHARLELHRALWAVRDPGRVEHTARPIYCDTDSVKFIGDASMDRLNEFYRERSAASGAYADNSKGKRYFMGVYDYEYTASKMATMGAKKYCYQKDGEDHLHVTIAGVNKKKGAAELEKLGGFSAFKQGTVFRDAGGVQGVYNDKPYGEIEVDGHRLYIGKNICLLPDTYTLGIYGDYARLLESIALRGVIDGETMAGGYEE